MTKRTAILMLVFSVLASGRVYSQKLSISGKELSLEEVIEMVKVQTGYGFVYNQDDIDRAKKVTLSLKNATLTEVLDQCLKPQGFTYDIKNKIIGIKKLSMKKKDSLEALPEGYESGIYSPLNKVTGVVIDTANGSFPLSDATILVKGVRQGT